MGRYLSMIGFWKIGTVRITGNCQASDYFGRSRGSARYQRDQSALIVARSYQKHACAILVDYVIFSDIAKLLCFVCPSFCSISRRSFFVKKLSCNSSLFHLYILNGNLLPQNPHTPQKCGINLRFFVVCRCLVMKRISMNDSYKWACSNSFDRLSWSVGNFDDTGCHILMQ